MSELHVQLRKRRAEYIAFHSGTFWWLDYNKEFAAHLRQTAQLVEANTDYAIYRLSEAPAD